MVAEQLGPDAAMNNPSKALTAALDPNLVPNGARGLLKEIATPTDSSQHAQPALGTLCLVALGCLCHCFRRSRRGPAGGICLKKTI